MDISIKKVGPGRYERGQGALRAAKKGEDRPDNCEAQDLVGCSPISYHFLWIHYELDAENTSVF